MMWPTKFVDLKHIEELLTCGICYELMDTAVVTSCSHNYCSLCIRKYLHYKTQCPICSEETFETDLRKNKILDEIIEQFLNIKKQLETKYFKEQTPTTKDTNLSRACSSSSYEYEKEVVSNTNETLSKTSDSAIVQVDKAGTSSEQKNYQQDAPIPSTPSTPSRKLKIPLMFTPKSRKGFRNEENYQAVICPVCKVDMPQNNINKHLDDCLKRQNAKDQSQSIKPKRKQLPKLVLSLMKDNVVRKKLKELGLSSQGERKTLESRLQKYTILYNAECDKTNPRPVSELIKQCEEEENLERKVQKPSNKLNINRNTEHNIIEQQRKKYLADNKDSFNHLITKVKHNSRNSSQKLRVRRNTLNKKKFTSHKNCITKNSPTSDKNNPTSDKNNDPIFESVNSRIDDSDSNASCPLQVYSSEGPIKFLKVELSSSSSNDSDQCANNDSSHSCKSSSNNIKKEIMQTDAQDESLESTLICAETTSDYWSSEHNISEDRLDNDTKESICTFVRDESENGEKIFFTKKRKHGATCSPENSWQNKSRDEDCIVENSDSDDIQSDCERSKHEHENELHVNAKEKYESNDTKLEKENLDSLEEDKKVYVFRKRERKMIALNDEEKNEDKSMNIRKSARLSLSEVKSFNNEIFGDDTRNEKKKAQNEKRQLRATRGKIVSKMN